MYFFIECFFDVFDVLSFQESDLNLLSTKFELSLPAGHEIGEPTVIIEKLSDDSIASFRKVLHFHVSNLCFFVIFCVEIWRKYR